MEFNDSSLPPKLNPQAAYSLTLGILALLFLCSGMIPLPFTGLICLPFSLLFGILSFVLGIVSLAQIRKRQESGRPLAWTGIIIGGIILTGTACIAATALALYLHIHGVIQPSPLFQNFQL